MSCTTVLCVVASEGIEAHSFHFFSSVSVLCYCFSEKLFIHLPTSGHVLMLAYSKYLSMHVCCGYVDRSLWLLIWSELG